MVTIQDLKKFDLFAGLDEMELAQVARLCTRRSCESASELFSPGVPAGDIFLLEDKNDAVQIELAAGERGPRTVIHTLQRGEAFGWAALVPPHQRTATARCVERASLICLRGQDLRDLLEKNQRMGYVVMKNLNAILSTRLSHTTMALRREIRRLSPRPVAAGQSSVWPCAAS